MDDRIVQQAISELRAIVDSMGDLGDTIWGGPAWSEADEIATRVNGVANRLAEMYDGAPLFPMRPGDHPSASPSGTLPNTARTFPPCEADMRAARRAHLCDDE
jgi:hypothetical protein